MILATTDTINGKELETLGLVTSTAAAFTSLNSSTVIIRIQMTLTGMRSLLISFREVCSGLRRG